MLTLCKYCGKVHDKYYSCSAKSKSVSKRNVTPEISFRKSYKWQKKRDSIIKRDNFLCQVCLNIGIFNTKNLEVHHIHKLKYNKDDALNDDFLITLCNYHHRLADCGKISEQFLINLLSNKNI